MILLAEIADKMPTIAEMWVVMSMISAVLAGIALTHRHAAMTMLLIGLALSCLLTYINYDEVWHDSISPHIWRELGWPWVINIFASSLLPGIVVVATYLDRKRICLDANQA